MIPVTTLESLAAADNILEACWGGEGARGGGRLIRTEWLCNTSPSSFLIKLPSYYFMWISARTWVLPELCYKSSQKKGPNWVKWIIWTQVCCTLHPFTANILHKQCFILRSPWEGWVRLLIPLEGAVRTDRLFFWEVFVYLSVQQLFRSTAISHSCFKYHSHVNVKAEPFL